MRREAKNYCFYAQNMNSIYDINSCLIEGEGIRDVWLCMCVFASHSEWGRGERGDLSHEFSVFYTMCVPSKCMRNMRRSFADKLRAHPKEIVD